MSDGFAKWIGDNAGRLTALRQDLHRHPELGFEEARPSQVGRSQPERILACTGLEVSRSC